MRKYIQDACILFLKTLSINAEKVNRYLYLLTFSEFINLYLFMQTETLVTLTQSIYSYCVYKQTAFL